MQQKVKYAARMVMIHSFKGCRKVTGIRGRRIRQRKKSAASSFPEASSLRTNWRSEENSLCGGHLDFMGVFTYLHMLLNYMRFMPEV
jgi:hypothetical protein